jgi:hypothetical protein
MTKKTTFSGIDRFLRETFGNDLTQLKLAKLIKELQPRYNSYLKNTQQLSSNALHKYVDAIYKLGIVEGRRQNAENFFKALTNIHELKNPEIAQKLIKGKTSNAKSSSLSNYKNGKTTISEKQYKNLLGKHSAKIFRPIFEFEECNPYKSGSTWKLFKDDANKENDVKEDLSNEESAKVGVYAMYDSSGRILYFGKTKNGLYKEITQRLAATVHRDVALVRNAQFKHIGNPGKSDKPGAIQVGEMTRYFTAVEVLVPEAISNIEAFVLRLIPNDDVNYKIENYEE